jgi:hypothetical protein
MKVRSFLILALVGAIVFLSVHPASAIIYGKREADEATIPWAEGIKHWDVGPGAQAEVVGSVLELKSDGNTGLFFNHPDVNPAELTDYVLEVSARKIGDDSKYFHLFVRTVVPTKDFYFVEVSYNSNTISMYEFVDGAAQEITPGGNAGRPKRPDSKDTKGGDHYILQFEAEGEILKYSVDGRLSIVTANQAYPKGPPGLGGRGGQVNYDWVRVDSLPDEGLQNIPSTHKQLAVESTGKLATTWGRLKRGF